MSLTDLDRFKAACVYPGELNEQAVERELAAFLQALGINRRIARLRARWRPEDDPPLNRIELILAEGAKRNLQVGAFGANAALTRRTALALIGLAGPFAFLATIIPLLDYAVAVLVVSVALASLTAACLPLVDGVLAWLFGVYLCALGLGFAFGTDYSPTAFGLVCLAVAAVADVALLLDHRDLLRAVRAARCLHATLGGDADFAFDVLRVRVGRDARAALNAREASAAGAADAALAVLDHRFRGFTAAVGVFGIFVTVVMLAASAAGVVGAIPATSAAGVFARSAAAIAVFFGGSVFLWAAVPLALAFVILPQARGLAAFATSPTLDLRPHLRGSTWELSWTVCALFGAIERRKPAVEAWLRPLFEAFVAGCWLLYWADDTLYWVAKPTVHREPGTQRLHHDTHAALESDVTNLYFWHGVMVPRFDLITIARIDQEANVEVRRAMIECYRHEEEIHGAAAFIRESSGERLDHHERHGTLWRRRFRSDEYVPGDEPIVMIEVVNRTPESDGRFKHRWLRVPPTMRTARQAAAWAFPDFWGSTENAAFAKYRQGDVLIVPVESIPEKLDAIDREDGRIVLARGEVNGHAHTIKAEGVALFRDPKPMAVFMTVSGDAPVALEHDDYDTIMIPPGRYQVVREREYSPRAL